MTEFAINHKVMRLNLRRHLSSQSLIRLPRLQHLYVCSLSHLDARIANVLDAEACLQGATGQELELNKQSS